MSVHVLEKENAFNKDYNNPLLTINLKANDYHTSEMVQ